MAENTTMQRAEFEAAWMEHTEATKPPARHEDGDYRSIGAQDAWKWWQRAQAGAVARTALPVDYKGVRGANDKALFEQGWKSAECAHGIAPLKAAPVEAQDRQQPRAVARIGCPVCQGYGEFFVCGRGGEAVVKTCPQCDGVEAHQSAQKKELG